MRCFRSNAPRTKPPPPSYGHQGTIHHQTVREEVLLQIQGCRAHLIDGSEAVELAAGDFDLVQVSNNGVALAMVVRIGNDLQWPVIKDEPVVKLDARDYLFTLPVKDGDPLSYGVTFFPRDPDDVVFVNSLELLDDFLRENSCFSSSSSSSSGVNNGIDWKEFAPRIEDYNNVVAKAIAGGTGHIIRGMFKCSNAYTNQVNKGGETMVTKAEKKSGASSKRNATTNKNQINKNLQRDPSSRLGSKGGANEIKQHAFFCGINWPLIRGTEPPPLDAPLRITEKDPNAKDIKWEDDGVLVNSMDIDIDLF
ncbi:hypothetical protein F2Q69_00019367 [Brassica cretica]|uniref:Senescence domain-containing protein n=1 Tax=Brassica cretica TaxID=69181 RepID=A0A8S9QH53_BRACR|nr:hypothetical protein F2Q69_00019367 [Brassica cretica]